MKEFKDIFSKSILLGIKKEDRKEPTQEITGKLGGQARNSKGKADETNSQVYNRVMRTYKGLEDSIVENIGNKIRKNINFMHMDKKYADNTVSAFFLQSYLEEAEKQIKNSKATVSVKGFDRGGVDTGQLAENLTGEVIE